MIRAHGEPRFRVVAVDLGIKSMTPYRMAERGIEVHVVPSTIELRGADRLAPDGVFFSNGPGDPGAADGPVRLLQQVLEAGIPFFGICFGNQLFGRALGFGTYKLPYGHRGINQPVMDLTTRRVEVTAHNHGFAVDAAPGEQISTPYGDRHRQPRRAQRSGGRGTGAPGRRPASCGPSRCSTTPKPPPDHTTPAISSTGSS